MFSFLFKTFRFLVIVGLVLILGQVPVEGRTVGEHFFLWVKQSFKSTQEKIAKSSLVASLPRFLSQEKASRQVVGGEKKAGGPESISSSDRESLLRVLQ